MFSGWGFVVYLLIIRGNIICKGIIGIVNKVKCFLGIFFFINFSFVIVFVVEKLICNIKIKKIF